MFVLWISIFLFLLLAEMGIPGLFFSLSISIGALFASLTAFVDGSFEAQLISCCAGAVAGFYILRSIASKIQSKSHTKTGAERLKGTVTLMLSQASNLPGTVHVAGTTWNAQSAHNEKIGAGQLVRIIDIKSTLLIVEPFKIQEDQTCTTSQLNSSNS